MKSEKGLGMVRLVIFLVAMMLLLGVTGYVVFQENGIYDRELKPVIDDNMNKIETIVEK